MAIETSAGAVVFHRSDKIEYLLLFSDFWGFPKGHIEPGEDEQTTARREIREEAGLEVTLLDGFRVVDEYMYTRNGAPVPKRAVFFLAESDTCTSRLSHEHSDMVWLPFEEALAKLRYEGGKQILTKANTFLQKRGA